MTDPVQLGRYACLQLIAEGPHSRIYRARVAGAPVPRDFLLRELAGAPAQDVNARRRFVLAATALMSIDDARLVSVIEARDLPRGPCFAAMEWVEGAPLSRVLQRQTLSEDACVQVAREVMAALATLGARRRVHGALSPSNVFVLPSGAIKVSDAGLRGALAGETLLPESDTRALGALIAEMLGGEPRGGPLRDAISSQPPNLDLLRVAGDAEKGRAELARAAEDTMAERPASRKSASAPRIEAARPASQAGSAAAAGARASTTPPARAKRPMWLPLGIAAAAVIGGIALVVLRHSSPPAAPAAPPKKVAAVAAAPTPPAPPAPAPVRAPVPVAPAAPAVAAPAPKELSIESTPAGALVYIDRQPRGTTPVRAALSEGQHQVVLLLPGNPIHRESVEWPGAPPLSVELATAGAPLRKGHAGIKVRCKTRGLRIFVDGIDTGQRCPSERIAVPSGEHRVGVYVPARDTLDEKAVRTSSHGHSTRIRFPD